VTSSGKLVRSLGYEKARSERGTAPAGTGLADGFGAVGDGAGSSRSRGDELIDLR
jgi:hypothetical protein